MLHEGEMRGLVMAARREEHLQEPRTTRAGRGLKLAVS
jgi:hypothetical protein